jgi:hypothetical protein
MLVIDEAHWLFNQSARIYTRPELVDWIVTAVCNRSVPIGLVTTPQFLQCMGRAIKQVEWNHRQFQRRVARRVVLPAKNTLKDTETVARWIFPRSSDATIKRILGYIALTKRDLSALGDIAREARFLLNPSAPETVDLAQAPVTFEQVQQIIDERLTATDVSFAQDLASALAGQASRKTARHALVMASGVERNPAGTQEREILPRRLQDAGGGNRMRLSAPVPALAGAQD